MTNMNAAMIALALSFLVQFGGIVWFAATMRSGLTQLNSTTRELHDMVRTLSDSNSLLDRRLAVVEDRQTRTRAGDPNHDRA